MSAVLEIENVSVARGAKTVVHNISMRLEAGKTVALLGPNGAGKSSLVLALAGLLPMPSGTVTLNGQNLTGAAPDRIRHAGIAAVPEGHQVLTELTVAENLEVATVTLPPGDAAAAMASAYEVFPELQVLRPRAAGMLSGGQQQMLALAQALIARPTFILADEMSLGLAPVVLRRLMEVVERIVKQGIGVLLIEQFTHVALKLADYAYVINRGEIRFSGTADELRANPQVLQEVYLAAAIETAS
jgi:branched-chain amino acid transport system ATP-binding protein